MFFYLFFSILAIIISCLGFFGLASYMAEKRTKEVGIRKVNGASAFLIVYLRMKNFLVWILYSFIIACPIAYFIMERWLDNYVYRITLSINIFLSGIIALVIATVTVAYQVYIAALKIPIEAIKYE